MTDPVVAPVVGISDTKEVLAFLFSLVEVVKKAKENDGKISVLDLPLLVTVFPKMLPAFSNLDHVLVEVKDLKEDEIIELAAYVGAEISSAGASAKFVAQVESGIIVAKSLVAFIKTF